MNPARKSSDETFDRNLRTIGRLISLPPEPAPEKLRRWSQMLYAAPDAADCGPATGDAHRPGRIIRLLGAIGALAASLLLAALLLLVPATTPRVHASMIFESFRDAVRSGFRLTFENIHDSEGILNGDVLIATDPLRTGLRAPESVYLEARFRSESLSRQELIFDMQVALAVLPDEQWTYMRLGRVPAEVLSGSPLITFMAVFAQSGIFVDMSERRGELGEPGLHSSIMRSFRTGFQVARDMAIAAATGGAPGDWLSGAAAEPARTAPSGEAKPGNLAGGVPEGVPGSAQISEAVTNVLFGKSSESDFEIITLLLERTARRIEVREVQRGLFILTASSFEAFDLDGDGAGDVAGDGAARGAGDAPPAGLHPDAVLKIAYREGAGVLWATFEPATPQGGSIRFESVSFAFDAQTHGRDRFLSNPATRVIRMADLRDSLAPFLSGVAEPR